ncbi:MAG: site-specific DNA-methyltransferase [Candidatus Acidiferrum sp.]
MLRHATNQSAPIPAQNYGRKSSPKNSPMVQTTSRPEFRTRRGGIYCCNAEDFFQSPRARRYLGKIQLIFTSPPFPLNTKKAYGNLQGAEYTSWLAKFAPLFKQMLTPTGSIVLEMGNAWEPGQPVMSTLALEGLLKFLKEGELKLAQQFICYNPARLPSPAQWVNVERIRLKDSYTHLWWMAANERPYADNRNVLKPYSSSMLKLLKTRKYNSGKRPSQHNIGEKSFLTNNSGAIPSNVLSFSNTGNGDPYQQYCRKHELELHPARMHTGLPEFFIKLLTKPGDTVLDPFAGSNTTGASAEKLKRRWIAIEATRDSVNASVGRFTEER